MDEAVAVVGRLGAEPRRGESREKRAQDADCVDHCSLADGRMRVDPLHCDFGPVGRERFRVDLVATATVQRVGDVSTQLGEVHLVGPAPDLFIAGEAEPHGTVLQFAAAPQQFGRRRHDDRHARLVVRTEQRRTVGRDDRMTDALEQVGILRDLQHLAILRQDEVATLIVLVNDRVHVRRGILGRRVHVCDVGNDWHGLRDRGRNRRHHDPKLIARHVGEAERAALVRQQTTQRELLHRARIGRTGLVGLSVDLHVTEKAVEERGHWW